MNSADQAIMGIIIVAIFLIADVVLGILYCT